MDFMVWMVAQDRQVQPGQRVRLVLRVLQAQLEPMVFKEHKERKEQVAPLELLERKEQLALQVYLE
jgi:hypothetical protein